MTYEVIIKTVAAEPMAAVAARADAADLPRVIPAALDKVYAALRAGDAGPLGRNVVLYASTVPGAPTDLQVGVRLAQPFKGDGEVQPVVTPAGDVAHVVYWGDYAKMHPAHQAAQLGARQQGRRVTGVSWEVYGDWCEDAAKLRTDIYYQLEAKARG